jgi:RHS repeat-associated protein
MGKVGHTYGGSQGKAVERYAYTPYGEMVVLDATGAPKALQEPLQPYGYTGRRYDSETGLWYFRNRYFDAELGRFIGRDKLGYVDGMSLYRGYFVPNYVDPSGNTVCCTEKSLWYLAMGFDDLIPCMKSLLPDKYGQVIDKFVEEGAVGGVVEIVSGTPVVGGDDGWGAVGEGALTGAGTAALKAANAAGNYAWAPAGSPAGTAAVPGNASGLGVRASTGAGHMLLYAYIYGGVKTIFMSHIINRAMSQCAEEVCVKWSDRALKTRTKRSSFCWIPYTYEEEYCEDGELWHGPTAWAPGH